ncbi:uncharacterized protein MONOS_14080 [Monocercomonoides exilis]|uniref:uncharacterized protein n=1 Tax=Monocercomonoides exilis TaxID=2049356 RepID=UPI0035594AB0|nr:hypothetical protein MONOS_14080 [Monocercomonoides exilis]|eukprot:MONOS_14080.1-p1 / transcript=MONOS_14080.1 / gene=MONOS_14080 / organism=Monocercomonoides_exilis_PA203 / gene_product=unspecified product / transcript_product=unspecified product / location=Mono_scaffold00933:6623-8006(-) / protein_length=421 / sequence_SO=supercontig / SO=protein_coding / is_pseudo=false
MQETCNTKKFNELFSKLSNSSADEQREKIEEMNELMEEMGEEEFKSVFTKEWFNEIDKMIEEKTLSWENAILLLKHVGYCQTLKCFYDFAFKYSFLSDRFQEMIIEEKMMIEEKDEKLLVDLCECYLLLNRWPSSEMSSIIAPCILKVALKKEENEETQKEVEMALLALSNIPTFDKLDKELYLNEIKEIIKYQQEHHNLTRIAYQSAWEFLIKRFYWDKSLEEVIVNEVHFEREAIRELEELAKWMNWKKKEEEMSKKEAKEVLIIGRWLHALGIFFRLFRLWKEEFAELIGSVAHVCRAARENNKEISNWCICSFRDATENGNVRVEDLLKGRAIDVVLEEIHRQTLNEGRTNECFQFFMNVSRKLKQKNKDEREEEERKSMKKKVFEKMEEEGYEDIFISFQKTNMFYFDDAVFIYL